VGNVSIAWIRHVVAEDASRPFFAYIAPKAAHEPFNPAPWYRTYWDPSWPTSEPTSNPAWNSSFAARADHHGNIATESLITTQVRCTFFHLHYEYHFFVFFFDWRDVPLHLHLRSLSYFRKYMCLLACLRACVCVLVCVCVCVCVCFSSSSLILYSLHSPCSSCIL
jgi:hypothetical protein